MAARARPAASAAGRRRARACWSRASTSPISCSFARPAVSTSLRSARPWARAVRRLVRQLLVESLLLAAFGGLLGLALAAVAVNVLQRPWPRRPAAARRRRIRPRGAGICGADHGGHGRRLRRRAGACVFGRIAPSQALRQQSRSTTGTRRQGRLRSGLAAAQLALALTLLVGAGCAAGEFPASAAGGPWVPRRPGPHVRREPSERSGTTPSDAPPFRRSWLAGFETLPGVRAAGGISRLPATGSYHPWGTRHRQRAARRQRAESRRRIQHPTAHRQRR